MAATALKKRVTLDDLIQHLDEERKERMAAEAVAAKALAERIAERKEREAERDAAAAKALAEWVQAREAERAADRADWHKKMGELSNRLGDVAEYMFDPEIIKKRFEDLGYFIERSTRNMHIDDSAGKYIAEFDITLHNGRDVVLIEVKTQATQRDVDNHIARITRVKDHNSFPGKTLIGGVASPVLHPEVKAYAIGRGLYVIEHDTEEIEVLPKDKNFQPKRW
jgi:hypothetical protein